MYSESDRVIPITLITLIIIVAGLLLWNYLNKNNTNKPITVTNQTVTLKPGTQILLDCSIREEVK